MAGFCCFCVKYKTPNLYTILEISHDSSRLEILVGFLEQISWSFANKNNAHLYRSAVAFDVLNNAKTKIVYDKDLRAGGGQVVYFTFGDIVSSIELVVAIQNHIVSLCSYALIYSIIFATSYCLCFIYQVDFGISMLMSQEFALWLCKNSLPNTRKMI